MVSLVSADRNAGVQACLGNDACRDGSYCTADDGNIPSLYNLAVNDDSGKAQDRNSLPRRS